MSIAKVIEIVGNSDKGWEDAARNGLAKAAETIRNIHGIEVLNHTATVEDGQIKEYKVDLKIAFTYEGD